MASIGKYNSTLKTPPVVPGDRVEIVSANGVFGEVIAVQPHKRLVRRGGSTFEQDATLYTVLRGDGVTVQTVAVSYAPTPETVAQRTAVVREVGGGQRLDEADFVGYDGPGIRETAPVFSGRGVAL